MDIPTDSNVHASPPLDLATLPYLSPTLDTLQLANQLKPFPACGMCPAAIWYKTAKTLNCFCSRMHAITWNGKEPPILNCDGQVLAILQMEQEQSS